MSTHSSTKKPVTPAKDKNIRATSKKDAPKASKVSKLVKKPLATSKVEAISSAETRPNSNASAFTISPTGKTKHQRRKAGASTRRRVRLDIVIIIFMLTIGGGVGFWAWQRQHGQDETPTATQNESQKQSEDGETKSNATTKPKSDIESQREAGEARVEAANKLIETSTFSSESVYKLNAILYKQTYGQSCEASSLRMALSYRGIATTDMDLLNLMGYDGVVAKKVDGQMIWTDPHKQFVGDKDGDQTSFTGYGVFAEPIVAASEKSGRAAALKDDVDTDWIVAQIYAGNPVLLWGVSIKISDGEWKTSAGDDVTVPMRTHTRLVIGVKGDPKNPIGFYINNPANGESEYWTTAKLKTNVANGNGQAVAVY